MAKWVQSYRDFMVDVLAMPVYIGRKTKKERFAGGINTLTCEAVMADGKALQMGTSHELGQNFARAFEIDFLDSDGNQQLAWTTSWGVSTRMLGGLIMAHGDDNGLRIPPRLAHLQAVVLLVRDEDGAGERAHLITESLRTAGVKVQLDARTDTSFGRRVTDWELKGVPLRVEVGPRDLANEQVTLVRRDNGAKDQVALTGLSEAVTDALEQAQLDLLASATEERDDRTVDVGTLEEAREAGQTGFARLPWALVGDAGEEELARSAITVRCIQRPDGTVPASEDEDDLVALVARSY
jgi:prolyl-tRNA synthetase